MTVNMTILVLTMMAPILMKENNNHNNHNNGNGVYKLQ